MNCDFHDGPCLRTDVRPVDQSGLGSLEVTSETAVLAWGKAQVRVADNTAKCQVTVDRHTPGTEALRGEMAGAVAVSIAELPETQREVLLTNPSRIPKHAEPVSAKRDRKSV